MFHPSFIRPQLSHDLLPTHTHTRPRSQSPSPWKYTWNSSRTNPSAS